MVSSYYIYIISNINRTTFYIGITNNLLKRIYEHRNGLVDGFSKKYKLKDILYFEEYTDIREALKREKQLKNWHREWKVNLIKSVNPQLKNLDAETSSA